VKPARLEVIAPTFEGLGICTSCELVLAEAGVGENPTTRAFDEYPQEWQDDYRRLTEWVYDLAGRYGDRLLIKVIRSPVTRRTAQEPALPACGAIPRL